jgi:hypothetical protein
MCFEVDDLSAPGHQRDRARQILVGDVALDEGMNTSQSLGR